jgi:condensin complex subunit 3
VLAVVLVTNAFLFHNQCGYLSNGFVFVFNICVILCSPLCIVGRLELDFNLDIDGSVTMLQTPAPRSTRPPRSRRRVRRDEVSSDEEVSPTSVVPTVPGTISMRSQRASKTAALTKMTVSRSVRVDSADDEEEEGSEVTSEEDSDESECEG